MPQTAAPPPCRTTHPRFDVIISDIDGCLSPEASTPIDIGALVGVADHNRLGIQKRDRPVLTVCSGRPQPFAEAMCRFLSNTVVPCVAENGVWLYDPRTNEYMMDPAITREHLAAVREASDWLDREFGPRGVSQQPGKAASVSLYHPDTAYLKSIAGPIGDEFAKRGWPMRVSMTWLYINCDLKHISKATGVARLVKMLGVERGRIAGIGDTMSDAPIREAASWFACPANAAPEIKKTADYVSGQAEAAGVVDILQKVMQR